jgi:predicted nucleotidyltransferase
MNKLYKKILNIKYLPKVIKILMIAGINWTFQSLLYMDKTEKVFKLILDLTLLVIFYILLNGVLTSILALLTSFIVAHTINWIFNGHLFALLKTFGMIKTKPATFINYINDLKDRSSNEKGILLVATFGSISRGELKETSDLDIRIVRKEGFFNGFKVCLFTMLERSRAFLNKFPLDIYVLDNSVKLSELSEKPILIYAVDKNKVPQ